MIIPIDIKPPKRVEKIWGHELWVHNDEDYCDDLNYLSEHESDLQVIENTFDKFELSDRLLKFFSILFNFFNSIILILESISFIASPPIAA